MGKTMVEASTEIDDLITQKNSILVKIANTVAAVIVDRTNNGKIGGLHGDIDNLLKNLSEEEKCDVLIHAVISIAKNKAGGGNKASKPSSRDSLFDRFPR